ncbi:MAG: M24 family metallopeptidase [Peptococcaceae bacterium]
MSIFKKRLAGIQSLLQQKNIDFLVLGPTTNMYYVTGLKTVADERFQTVLISAGGEVSVILPQMYGEEAREILDKSYRLITWSDGEHPLEAVRDVIDKKSGRVAVDERMWAGHFLDVMGVLREYEFLPAQDILEQVRIRKDETEIQVLQKAGKLADCVMGQVHDLLRPGITEREVALFIESSFKNLGAEGISFKPIVAFGANGSSPHYATGGAGLEKGNFVTTDFGCILDGYCSDITRTVCFGKATPEMREIYQIVQEANQAGFAAVAGGVSCEAVDSAARGVIEKAGYGRYFIHRTGHGIGLDYHEAPYLVRDNKTLLDVGMAFSIEPGIYLPGKLGVRIEDIVVLTADGAVRLNHYPRELLEIH